jgi:uncharacterized protein (TIRG00374 family)
VSAARKVWRIGWRVGICALLLAWIFQIIFYNEGRVAFQANGQNWGALTRWDRLRISWQYGPSGLLETLTSIDLKYLLLSIFLMGALLFVSMLRWQVILKVHGLAMPLLRTTEISLIAHFFNSFLLGSVGGDLLKAYYVARETHHKKTEAVVTVLADRVVGLFSMLLLACILIIPNLTLLFSTPRLKTVVWLILAMTLACAGFIVVSFWGGVSKTIPQARVLLRKLPKGEMIERAIDAFREFGRDRTFFLRVLPVALCANVICILHFLALLRGFHLSVPIIPLSAIVLIVTCISTLPITPSGLGVRENLYVWMLAVPGLNIPPAEALLVSLVGYGTSLFWSAIGGFVYLLQREKEHLEEIATEAAAPSRVE